LATCERVKRLLPGRLDGDGTAAERLVVDQHVSTCPDCALELEIMRAVAASLYETFAPERLGRDLVAPVVGHLPRMEPSAPLHDLTERVKHPRRRGLLSRCFSWVPVGAMMVMAVLVMVLWIAWPRTQPLGATSVGMVVHREGRAVQTNSVTLRSRSVRVRDGIVPGTVYETSGGAAVMLALKGASEARVFEGSRMRVNHDRSLHLEAGMVHLKVGKGQQYFRVGTRDGQITVFGTEFGVEILPETTRVTVVHGEVQVENRNTFTVLRDGEATLLGRDFKELITFRTDVSPLMDLVAALDAHLDKDIALNSGGALGTATGTLRAERVFVVETHRQAVRALHFRWKPGSAPLERSGYDVYVSDNSLRPVFKGRIEGWMLSDIRSTSCSLALPEDMGWSDIGLLHIMVLPDFASGPLETNFSEVYATTY